jgi:GPH family glycoside/pentoside/hexuronide:cation symporter
MQPEQLSHVELAISPTPTGTDEKLPLSIKLAYGMPNFAGAAMVIPIAIHMNIFYSDVVMVPLGYIALAVALARSFDAITDPLMGWISDRTRTSLGRRRPWMLVGAPLCAVAFVLLCSPPASLSVPAAAAWFTSTFVIYFLFHTIYSIPHYGLGPELTQDYHERSSLFAVMEGFTLLGTICAAALPGLVLFPMFGERVGFTIFAVAFGSILTLLYFWQCYRIRERPEFYNRKPNPLIPGVRRVMRNRPFRILLATYVVGSVTGAIPGLMMPYFTTYVLQVEDPQRWIGIYLLTYFFFGFATLPLWLRATRRWGKKPIYIVSGLMGVSSSLMLFFMDQGDVWPTFWILVWAGSSFGVRVFLGPSIQADVIDYDELYTGKRREAQYGALWAIMTKFTVIPSAAVPLAILATLGYVPNVEQSETLRFAISAIFGLAPATFGSLSVLLFLFFPINESIHREIRRGIEKHQRGESAVDPLTGRRLAPPSTRGIDEDTGWFLDHFSAGELRHAVRRGNGALLNRTLLAASASLALCLLFSWLTIKNVGDLHLRPGLTTVFEVVAAGFALTAFLFHAIRVRAAWRLARSSISAEDAQAHLEDTVPLGQTRQPELG